MRLLTFIQIITLLVAVAIIMACVPMHPRANQGREVPEQGVKKK
jgi:hypothetical protein